MNSKNYQEAQTRANYCRLFSNPYRVLIVWALHRKELSVSELAEEIQATLQNTSQHLRVMKHCGLVEARREGQTIFYHLAEHPKYQDCLIYKNQRNQMCKQAGENA